MLDWLGQTFDAAYFQDLLKMITAVLCGLLVGVERTFRGKPAGVRTNVLICLGSCLFMIASMHVAGMARAGGFATADPARIAAQVVSGIGFLGAGTILRNRGLVTGLTSAASVWVVAAIGLLIGAGLAKLAITSAVVVVLAIEGFGLMVRYVRVERFRSARLEIVCKREETIRLVRKTLRRMSVVYSQEGSDIVLGETHYHASLYFRGSQGDIQLELSKLKGVRHVLLLEQSVD